jgi:hypothetical protein
MDKNPERVALFWKMRQAIKMQPIEFYSFNSRTHVKLIMSRI